MAILDIARLHWSGGVPESTGYHSARTGPAPRLVAISSLTDELDSVAAQIPAWIDADTAPATIAVLARDKFRCERLANGLPNAEWPPGSSTETARPPTAYRP